MTALLLVAHTLRLEQQCVSCLGRYNSLCTADCSTTIGSAPKSCHQNRAISSTSKDSSSLLSQNGVSSISPYQVHTRMQRSTCGVHEDGLFLGVYFTPLCIRSDLNAPRVGEGNFLWIYAPVFGWPTYTDFCPCVQRCNSLLKPSFSDFGKVKINNSCYNAVEIKL